MSSSSKENSPKTNIKLTESSIYSNPSYKGDDSDRTESHPTSPVSETPFIISVANLSDSKSSQVNYDDVLSVDRLTDEIVRDDQHRVSGNTSTAADPPAYDNLVPVAFAPQTSTSHSKDEEKDEDSRIVEHSELVLKIRKTMPLKDFTNEVRAPKDLQRFLEKPTVVLDVAHTKLYLIVEELLTKLKNDLEVDEKITSQAAKAFFTFQDERNDSFVSVDQLRETIQGVVYRPDPDEMEFEQSWLTALCSLPSIKQSHIAIARLSHPVNFGTHAEEVKFVVAVIAPQKEKFTKTAVELGRTFSSLLTDSELRSDLIDASDETEFKDVFVKYLTKFKTINDKRSCVESGVESGDLPEVEFESYTWKQCGRGVYDDLKRRIPYYVSDFVDGVVGKNTISKLLSTILFLYFACLLPDIAFGSLYQKVTGGKLNVFTCILSQTLGGLAFAFFGGQPLLIMLTTAPLALYVKVIKTISNQFGLNFGAMYTMVGLWNAIFLLLEAFFNLSQLMKYSTRSTEEIFGFFIALAFSLDAIKATVHNFEVNFHFPPTNFTNVTELIECQSTEHCYRPENSLLFLVLMLGTLWFGMVLLNFDKSPLLSAKKREILADYALPISVVVFSFIGSYAFRHVNSESFKYDPDSGFSFEVPDISSLPATAHLGAMGLGLCLSFLFFVDQNVSAAFVNAPQNKLKKGSAYHWDLVVVALINAFLSIFNLPWVHAALPHSPLHVRGLADMEQHVTSKGTVIDEVVKVRETRLSGIISHALIGLTLLFVNVLQYIPISVLQGLFLFLGLSSFNGNQFFDRLLLIFTEECSYPPTHYVRKVPKKKMHLFTLIQLLQLAVVCVFGFSSLYYMKMIFPVIILLLLPIRNVIVPYFIEAKYLKVLDS